MLTLVHRLTERGAVVVEASPARDHGLDLYALVAAPDQAVLPYMFAFHVKSTGARVPRSGESSIGSTNTTCTGL